MLGIRQPPILQPRRWKYRHAVNQRFRAVDLGKEPHRSCLRFRMYGLYRLARKKSAEP